MGTDIDSEKNKSKNECSQILEELIVTAQESRKHKAVKTIKEFQKLLENIDLC